jgi:hypothetical protein
LGTKERDRLDLSVLSSSPFPHRGG